MMKDNKKIIIIIALIVVVLIGCLVGVRMCEKGDKPKDPDTEQNGGGNSGNTNTPDDETPSGDDSNGGNTTNGNGNSTPATNISVSTPSIKLLGDELVYVELGDVYTEKGVEASDSKYGDLTAAVVTTGTVDTKTLGTYTLTYTVTNSDNKSATVTRTVIVRDTTPPEVTIDDGVIEEDGIYLTSVEASKIKELKDALTITDNSGTVSLIRTYYLYDELSDDFIELTGEDTKVDLSIPGIYMVVYEIKDESDNKLDPIAIVYVVADTEAPSVNISKDGTLGAMMNPSTTITVDDNLDDIMDLTTQYVWWSEGADATNEPTDGAYQTMPSDGVVDLNAMADGTYYLWVKVTDRAGNTSTLISEAFVKKADLLVNNMFDVYGSTTAGGITTDLTLNGLTDVKDVTSITTKLYAGDVLLATNTTTEKLMEQILNGDQLTLTTKFVVNGNETDALWNASIDAGYTMDRIPSKVVFEVTYANGVTETLTNTVLNENTVIWEKLFVEADIIVGLTRGDYHNITDAITNANNNDKIYVLNGTYDEVVRISGKNLSIEGQSLAGVIVTTSQAPEALGTEYQGQYPVMGISDNSDVTLKNITITTNVAVNTIDGVTVIDSNVSMDKVHIFGIHNTNGLSGVQYGRAITVHGNSDLTVKNSTIEDFNKNGIHALGANASLTVENTVVRGAGKLENIAAQNGIVFQDGATGSVTNCSLENFMYFDYDSADPNGDYAAGILQYESGNVVVTNNSFPNCDKGLEIYTSSVDLPNTEL